MVSNGYDERARGALTVALAVLLTYKKRRRARILAQWALALDVLENMEMTEGEESEDVVGPVSNALGNSTHDRISPRGRGM